VGVFFAEDSFAVPPDWVSNFFQTRLDANFKFLTATSRGVLIVEAQHKTTTRLFAVVFGHGRHLLRDAAIEERFGMKVVLNSVDRGNLRSIERTTLGATPKQSREQMSRESEAASFGIDIDQDLLNAVTGRSNDQRLGKTIAGRDSLSVAVKVDQSNIKDFLPVCIEKYESDDYKKEFEWIDQIKDVRDHKTTTELDGWLTERLKKRELDKIWMAPPSILDWVDIQGFRYGGKKLPEVQTELDVATFLDTLKGAEPTLDTLKQRSIHAVSSKTESVIESWTSYKCLYAEATIGKDVYVLNNGKWYAIASDFTAQVKGDFDSTPDSAIAFPEYAHADEGAYNLALSGALPDSFCLDQNLISYGGGYSRVEFCDVFTATNQIIHVKRYSGSSQLSHLFNQGVVSGELFVSAPEFRERLNGKLPAHRKLADTSKTPVAADYEIVFAIVTSGAKALDIPFFSKVSLRNARRRLQAYGFKVTKKKVVIAPPKIA